MSWCGSAGFWGPWSWFGPGGARRPRFFEAGEVRLAILSLLEDGPKHGYQLMKEIEERSGGLYRTSAGTMYPTLQQLEDEGLIESSSGEGRRAYRITEAGRRELRENAETVRRIWRKAEHWEDWSRNMGPEVFGMLGPLADVAKSAFHATSWAGGRTEREDRIRGILSRAARELDDLTKV